METEPGISIVSLFEALGLNYEEAELPPEFEESLYLLVDYTEKLERRGRKLSTIASYAHVIFKLVRFLYSRGLHTSPFRIKEPEILEILKNYPEVSDHTKRDYISILSRWMEDIAENNTVKRMDLLWPDSERPGRKWADLDDLNEILKTERDPVNRMILVLATDEGMRAGEMASVRMCDLQQDGWIRIRGKGHGEGKIRSMPLTQRVEMELEKYMSYRDKVTGEYGHSEMLLLTKKGMPFCGHTISQRVIRLGKKSGKELTAHSIRRRFITDVLDSGVKIEVCSKMVGHDNPATTALYYKCDEEAISAAMIRRTRYVNNRHKRYAGMKR